MCVFISVGELSIILICFVIYDLISIKLYLGICIISLLLTKKQFPAYAYIQITRGL